MLLMAIIIALVMVTVPFITVTPMTTESSLTTYSFPSMETVFSELAYSNFTQQYAGLTSIPGFIPMNTTDTILSHNNITMVTSLSYLASLTSVNLHDNKIVNIAQDVFDGTMLQILDLSKNLLTQVPNLTGIENTLFSLNLGSNLLTTVGDELKHLTVLSILYMSRNSIATVSSSAFCGTALTVLQIKENELTEVPDIICLSDTLSALDVGDNQITQLNASHFERMNQLVTFDGAKNHIDVIQDHCFANLSSLVNVYLSYNRLDTIPSNLFENTSIEILDLSGNSMNSFPDLNNISQSLSHMFMPTMNPKEIMNVFTHLYQFETSISPNAEISQLSAYFPNLYYLVLNGNGVINNTEGFLSGFTHLQELTIDSLGAFEISNLNTPSLGYIKIVDNNIPGITESTFQNCTGIGHLSLYRNDLQFIHPDALIDVGSSLHTLNFYDNPELGDLQIYSSLTSLETLNMKNTGATVVPNLSHMAETLQVLSISDNPVISLDGSQFTSLSQLETFKMSGVMTNIPALPDISTLFSDHSLRNLYMEENTFPCDCDSVWLYDVITDTDQSTNVYIDSAPCRDRHAGVDLTTLSRLQICDIVNQELSSVPYVGACALHCISVPEFTCLNFTYDPLTSVCHMTRRYIFPDDEFGNPVLRERDSYVLCDSLGGEMSCITG